MRSLQSLGSLSFQKGSVQFFSDYLKSLGPSVYYPLDETTGTTAVDAVGSLDGTNSGATINQAGQVGLSYSFDGSNDFISIPDNALIEGMANVSMIFMLKIPSTSSFLKVFFKAGSYDFGISNNGEIFGELNGIGNPGTWGSSPGVDDNAWRIYGVTYDGSTMRLYINGLEVENLGSLSGSVGTGNGNLALGRHEANQNEYYKGLMQHVALFDKALSAPQVLKLAQKAGLA